MFEQLVQRGGLVGRRDGDVNRLVDAADRDQHRCVGYRERFRHELVDLHECPVLEPDLFVLISRLREVSVNLIPPGGSAEATLTRTDSGIDLLIEAAGRPDLGICEIHAELAEECDLARIVWRSGADEILVVERRPVRVLPSGVPVSFPPGAFLQASASAEMILVEEVLPPLTLS